MRIWRSCIYLAAAAIGLLIGSGCLDIYEDVLLQGVAHLSVRRSVVATTIEIDRFIRKTGAAKDSNAISRADRRAAMIRVLGPRPGLVPKDWALRQVDSLADSTMTLTTILEAVPIDSLGRANSILWEFGPVASLAKHAEQQKLRLAVVHQNGDTLIRCQYPLVAPTSLPSAASTPSTKRFKIQYASQSTPTNVFIRILSPRVEVDSVTSGMSKISGGWQWHTTFDQLTDPRLRTDSGATFIIKTH